MSNIRRRPLLRRRTVLILGAGILLLLLAACSRPVQRRYFAMTEPTDERIPPGKYAVDLWIKEVEIAPVFNRPEIVYRYSPYELQYYSLARWADRPARMVSQLLLRSMLTSGLFRTVVDRLGTTPPTHVLSANVLAIEQLDSGDVWYAHLAMNLTLTDFPGGNVLWQYNFDERRPLDRQDLGLAVRALSEIYHEQMNRVILPQLEATLAGKPLPAPSPEPRAGPGRTDGEAVAAGPTSAVGGTLSGTGGPPAASTGAPAASVTAVREGLEAARAPAAGDAGGRRSSPIGPDQDEEALNWKQSMQYASDPTTVPPGKGAIFLPALADPDRESPAEVYRDGELVVSGSMGRRIPVDPGVYEVYFGSGTLSQRMMREVRVEEGETTVVPPDWAALEVSVVNERFIPFRGTYELIRMDDLEFIGVGFGADEELGEEVQVWVLRPGLYKIVQPGAGYRARTNFATVLLQPGGFVSFDLVLDENSRNFLGAGVAEYEGAREQLKRWSSRLVIGGDLQWIARSQGQTQQAGSTIQGNLFIDNLSQLRLDPHLWTTRLEIEEGLSLVPVAANGEETAASNLFKGEFRTSLDRLYLNSIYTYQLFRWFGPYGRVGLETHFFDSYSYFPVAREVRIFDEEGAHLRSIAGVDRVLLGESLSPLDLKQGAGANFQLFNTTAVNLDLRVGIGSRQHIVRNGQLLADDDLGTNDIYEVRIDNDYQVLGPEAVVLATLRPFRILQLSTELDSLLPFRGGLQFTWRSSASLRLGSSASLIYSVNLNRDPNLGLENPLRVEQSLQLRFYWEPF